MAVSVKTGRRPGARSAERQGQAAPGARLEPGQEIRVLLIWQAFAGPERPLTLEVRGLGQAAPAMAVVRLMLWLELISEMAPLPTGAEQGAFTNWCRTLESP